MGQYYYTIASMPTLLYEMEPPFTSDVFITSCKKDLSKKDFSILLEAKLNNFEPSKEPVLQSFIRWEKIMRNELVNFRAQRLEKEAEDYLRSHDYDSNAIKIAHEAFSNESPLKAEDVLNRGRWNKLDELEVEHYFDIQKLIIYSLKLQILERKELFTKENGEKAFQKIFETISEDIGSVEYTY